MASVNTQYRDPYPEPPLPSTLTNLKGQNQQAYFNALLDIKAASKKAFQLLSKDHPYGIHAEANIAKDRNEAVLKLEVAFIPLEAPRQEMVNDQNSLKVVDLETFILQARIAMRSLLDDLETASQRILSFFTGNSVIAPVTDQDFYDAYIAQLENTARICHRALSILQSPPLEPKKPEDTVEQMENMHKGYTALQARALLKSAAR